MHIKQIESITGLSKETLRIWEHRYGFPAPDRSDSGDRIYKDSDIKKLLAIKKLLLRGFTPQQVINLNIRQLHEIISDLVVKDLLILDKFEFSFVEALVESDTKIMHKFLNQYMQTHGLHKTLEDFIPRMNLTVGHKWELEEVSVYQEHLYTDVVERFLREQSEKFNANNELPKIVLTTLEGELHQIGMLLVNTYLLSLGFNANALGPSLPNVEIIKACEKLRPMFIGISISLNYDLKEAQRLIEELARKKDFSKIVIGGAGALKLSPIKNVELIKELKELPVYLSKWGAHEACR